MKIYVYITSIFLLLSPGLLTAQLIEKIIIEIHTADARYAGTDDDLHLLIGGKDFYLDNEDRDDFERNNTDKFIFSTENDFFSIELIREIGELCILKTEDSFWGGGWKFEGIKIWIDSENSAPIYEKSNINKWLDDDLIWCSNINEGGWNIPESIIEFPPCEVVIFTDDIIRKPDADCDGIPDENDPEFNPNPKDQDGDGIPDVAEEQLGLDPNNPDTDNDGWWDGNNRLTALIVTRIQCEDEEEDIGVDELFLVVEDVRFPLGPNLDQSWKMDDGTMITPYLMIDSRLEGGWSPGGSPPEYISRIRIREADPTFGERPFDDTYEIFQLNWKAGESYQHTYKSDDAHYIFSFKTISIPVADPNALVDADSDQDGIKESLEYLIATQDASLRPPNTTAITGYNGLATPIKREIFMEIDAIGGDNGLIYDAKQQVASQFVYQGIAAKIDDGYLGGGQVLPEDKETVTIPDLVNTYKPNHFWNERNNHFRYGLFTEHTEGAGSNGNASGKNIIVARSSQLGMWGNYSSIVFLHEWGHTLSLCHTEGGSPPVSATICDTNGLAPSGTESSCDHYCGIPKDSSTAMGDTIGLDSIIAGVVAGLVIGGLIGFAIGGWVGAIVGGIIGGLLGGLIGIFNSDAYLREVDFHVNEWAAILIDVFLI